MYAREVQGNDGSAIGVVVGVMRADAAAGEVVTIAGRRCSEGQPVERRVVAPVLVNDTDERESCEGGGETDDRG